MKLVHSLPTPTNEAKEKTVDILKDMLKSAENGEFTCVIVIAEKTDGEWCYHKSHSLDFPRAIGRLEIFKHEWIKEQDEE